MKALNEEIRERNNIIEIERAVRVRWVQAEEAEALYKFMTKIHRKKKREVEDISVKEVETGSNGRKSSNKRRMVRYLNETYKKIFNNNKGCDKIISKQI